MGTSIRLQCKAILFDMDGTLVDSTRIVELAWESWSKRHNIPFADVLLFSHGRPTISTLEHFLPGRDHSAELAELALYEETETEGITEIPGAGQILRTLEAEQFPWAIVTSAWRKLAESRVVAAGLPLPKVMVPIDEIRNGKPDPEGFLLAARQLGIAPADCLAFEDTRPGINAGLSAGMQVVGLLTTFSAQQLRHEPSIRDYRQVTFNRDGLFLQVDLGS